MPKVDINETRLLEKVERIYQSVAHLIKEIENGNEYLIGNLSVELRKLINVTPGNDLMKRLEKRLGIKFQMITNQDHPFLKPEKIGIDEFRNQIIFAFSGRVFTRLEFINLVANQEGAHLDDEEDSIIPMSEEIIFAVGSRGRLKEPLSQKGLFILEAAQVLQNLVKNNILPIYSKNKN